MIMLSMIFFIRSVTLPQFKQFFNLIRTSIGRRKIQQNLESFFRNNRILPFRCQPKLRHWKDLPGYPYYIRFSFVRRHVLHIAAYTREDCAANKKVWEPLIDHIIRCAVRNYRSDIREIFFRSSRRLGRSSLSRNFEYRSPLVT